MNLASSLAASLDLHEKFRELCEQKLKSGEEKHLF
jgi:hypothetical protein